MYRIRFSTLMLVTASMFYASIIARILISSEFRYIEYIIIGTMAVSCLRNLRKSSSQRTIALLFIMLSSILAVRGLLLRNWQSYWLIDGVVFAFGLLVLVEADSNIQKDFCKRLPNWVASWLIIGIPVSWFLLGKYQLSPATQFTRFNMSGDMSEIGFGIGAFGEPIFAAIYVAPFFARLQGVRKLAVLAGVMTNLSIGLITLTRHLIILSLIALVFILISSPRKLLVENLVRIFLAIIIVLAVWINIYGLNSFYGALTEFNVRMTKEDFSSGRTEETQQFFESITPVECVIGRGWGGAQTTWIWSNLPHGVGMVHYGFSHLILKGGGILLVFLYGLAILGFARLWNGGTETRPYGLMLLIFIVGDIGHVQWINLQSVFFYWIAVSCAFKKYRFVPKTAIGYILKAKDRCPMPT